MGSFSKKLLGVSALGAAAGAAIYYFKKKKEENPGPVSYTHLTLPTKA